MDDTSLCYTPASSKGWLAFRSAERLLVLGASADDALIGALWSAIETAAGFQAVLDVLTRNGLVATPPFALFDGTSASLRVIVRGAVSATATDASGEHVLSGTGVSTWVERGLTGVSAVEIAVTGATAVPDVPSLPISEGAALVASLELRFGESAGRVSGDEVSIRSRELATRPADGRPAEVAAGRVGRDEGAALSRPGSDGLSPEQPTPIEIDPEATVTEAPSAHSDAPEATSDIPSDGYDYLFGATVFRDVASAAVPERIEPEEGAAAEVDGRPDASAAGDHDGHTVLTSDVAKLRAERRSKRGKTALQPTLEARSPDAKTIVLAVSNGTREALDEPILVGRSPSVSQVSGGQMPKLVTVGTPDQDISRTHVRFVLEGGTVVVTDLHSRNGTMIVLPGKEPQKLRAGEPTSVILGTVIDLGSGVTLTVEEDTP